VLVWDVQDLLSQHQHDDPFLCVSGKPSIQCNNDVTRPAAAINSKTTVVGYCCQIVAAIIIIITIIE
jgi:hypothetical protein